MVIFSQDKTKRASDGMFNIAIKSDIKNGIYEIFAVRKQEGDAPKYVRLGKYDSLATLTYVINQLRDEHIRGTSIAQITDYNVVKIA